LRLAAWGGFIMISSGQLVTLDIEKPAAGGRMIARLGGQVVLVAGAIPGERVSARIERVGKGVAYADTMSVEEPAVDRRPPFTDPLCGGCLYAHIAYPRQIAIKAHVVADAFVRIGRLPLQAPVPVAASPDEGYRMRARLHARGGRIGFFREGSHELCDARGTRQLLRETCDILDAVAARFQSANVEAVRELDVSENSNATQRVVHLETTAPVDGSMVMAVSGTSGVTGLTASPAQVLAGDPYVTDTLLVEGRTIKLRRHVLAFFQGNRYLLQDLVAHVVQQIGEERDVVDLYAGTGLFSVAAAAVRGARVTAVEGERTAAADLVANASSTAGAVEAVHQSVEVFTATRRPPPGGLILDPPRTGLSKQAMQGAIRLQARTIVYVSCDVATLARDARRLVDAGYELQRIEGFDLFPNTPHVECVVTFKRSE
jgi:23S rRNA (uracil1939-C5)-methyltransferase